MNMKYRIICLAGLMAFCLATFAQQYQMEVKTTDGNITSYLMSSVNDVVYENGKTIINMNGTTKKEYDNQDIVNISWTEYKGNTSSTVKNFTIDENHTAIVTPEYSISLSEVDAETKQTLTVTKKKSISAQSGFYNMIKDRVVYDISMGDKHELEGIAEIRFPMSVPEDYFVLGLYYDTTAKKWENVNHYYDATTGELVIRTSHFSQFAGFLIHNENRRNLFLEYEYLPSYMDSNVADLAGKLSSIVQSDNVVAAAIEKYGSQYGEWTQIGIDIGWTSLQSLGVGSTLLEDFAGVLGNLGVALSSYQVCRDNFHSANAQVAGNTLKLCMNRATYWAGEFCGNAILTASMASVAILDYALNKFAERAWSLRKDHYREAFEGYYHQGGKGYRTGAEWYRIMWKIMNRKDIQNEDDIHRLVDEEVVNYCNQVWNDERYILDFESIKGTTIGLGGGNIACKELSAELRGDLYNGVLQPVFARIKAKLEDKAYMEAEKQMKKYAEFVNQIVTLKIVDSSYDANDFSARSRFAGCTVRFKDLPKNIEDPENWQCVLDGKSEGKIQYTLAAAAYSNVAQTLEVLAADEEKTVLGTFKLTDLNAGKTTKESQTTKANVIDLAKIVKSEINTDPAILEFSYEEGKGSAQILTTGLTNVKVSTTSKFVKVSLVNNAVNVDVEQNNDGLRHAIVSIEGVGEDKQTKRGYLTVIQTKKPEHFQVKNITLIGLQKNGASYRSFASKDFKSCDAFFDGSNYIIESVLADNRTLKVTIKKVGTGNKKFGDAYMVYEEKTDKKDGFVRVYGNLPLDASSESHAAWKGKCMVHSKWLEGWEPDTHYEEGEYMNDVDTTLMINFGDISQLP